jgi:hypothetical protein
MHPLALVSLQLTVGRLRSEELPMMAANMLVDGYDTPALREAAGVSSYDADKARTTFRQALTELGCEEHSEDESWWRLAKWTAQRIVDGDLSAWDGCTAMIAIGRNFWCRDLDWFVGIESTWEGDPEHAADYTAQTLEAARELLGLEAPRRWVRLVPRSLGPFFAECRLVNRSSEWCDVDDADVPISLELHDRIRVWAEVVEDDLDDYGIPTFATTDAAEVFVDQGSGLKDAIQGELGSRWMVEFYPPPTHPGGRRWEDHG